MNARRLTLLPLVAAAFAALAAAAPDSWRDELAGRLAALRPDRPVEYVALAEDVMDRADPAPGTARDADRALAVRLASLAGAVDVAGTGRSAALFLAAHAVSDADRARFESLATALDTVPDAAQDADERRAAALALLRAFGHYRRGEGAKAREALAAPGASALLDSHPEVLKGGVRRFLADCDAMRRAGAPSMTARQLDALHVLAAASLAGGARSWGETLGAGGLAPLPEVDLSDPKVLFGVDPRECLWRDGRWVRDASGGPAR